MRYILHIDLDTFFVSVERLLNPELVGKPVLCGGTSERSVVSTASYEARKFGVHSGMPMVTARRMCPQAVVVYSGHKIYSHYSQLVTNIVEAEAPLYEKASVDEFYIDLSGMDKYFNVLEWSHNLRMRIINETNLPISFGLAPNKTVAKIASAKAKPMGEIFVDYNHVQDFLDPLPVQKIPGVGESSLPKINSLGIHTIKDLRLYPKSLFVRTFGKYGEIMWQKANGIDDTPLCTYRDPKSISNETTFETDVIDRQYLIDTIIYMCDALSHRLRKLGKNCVGVSIKLRFPSFKTVEKSRRISSTNFTDSIISTTQLLFNQLYNGEPIRLIGVKFDISDQIVQNSIFDYSPKKQNLYRAIDSLQDRFGSSVIQRGNTISTDSKDEGSLKKD
ncbi:MAG: DNA polymerase IV [Bacteroidales bacterium]|nr:DNA polymerase IV [Bacteroidales bacterium]